MWDCHPHPAPVFPLMPFLLAEAWSDGLWMVLVIFERGDMGWANPLTGKTWIPKEDSRHTGWERHSFCVYVYWEKMGHQLWWLFRMHSWKTIGSILLNWPVVCSSILGQRQSSVWSSGPFFLLAFCLLVSYYLRHPHVIKTFSPSSPNMRASLWLSWWRICLQCGRSGFDPWVGKIPWRRARLPTPVFWPREFHGLYSPWGRKESDTTEWLSLHLVSCMGL